VQAKSLVINGIEGVAGPTKWVDFGLRALAVEVALPEDDDEDLEEGGGEKQAVPEYAILPYGE